MNHQGHSDDRSRRQGTLERHKERAKGMLQKRRRQEEPGEGSPRDRKADFVARMQERRAKMQERREAGRGPRGRGGDHAGM